MTMANDSSRLRNLTGRFFGVLELLATHRLLGALLALVHYCPILDISLF